MNDKFKTPALRFRFVSAFLPNSLNAVRSVDLPFSSIRVFGEHGIFVGELSDVQIIGQEELFPDDWSYLSGKVTLTLPAGAHYSS